MAGRITQGVSFTKGSPVLKGYSLPIFLTPGNKYWVGGTMFLIAAVAYITSNHFHIFPPVLLPMSAIDQWVPFIPQTVWIYTSEYWFFVTVYLVCKDLENVNKYLYSFLALQIFSVMIFWIWPTTYPRENFPLPNTLDSITYAVFSSLRNSDTPANCCPSLHVSSVYLSSFMFLDEQKEKFPLFFAWGTAIALSTLTTKQHYLIDVVLGLALAVIFYWVFHRLIRYYRVSSGLQANR